MLSVADSWIANLRSKRWLFEEVGYVRRRAGTALPYLWIISMVEEKFFGVEERPDDVFVSGAFGGDRFVFGGFGGFARDVAGGRVHFLDVRFARESQEIKAADFFFVGGGILGEQSWAARIGSELFLDVF